MLARLATRTASSAALASKRAAPAALRYNSSSSSNSAARMMEMAARTERPTAAEVSVPILWVLTGALSYVAWSRMSERTAGPNVEKLLIV